MSIKKITQKLLADQRLTRSEYEQFSRAVWRLVAQKSRDATGHELVESLKALSHPSVRWNEDVFLDGLDEALAAFGVIIPKDDPSSAWVLERYHQISPIRWSEVPLQEAIAMAVRNAPWAVDSVLEELATALPGTQEKESVAVLFEDFDYRKPRYSVDEDWLAQVENGTLKGFGIPATAEGDDHGLMTSTVAGRGGSRIEVLPLEAPTDLGAQEPLTAALQQAYDRGCRVFSLSTFYLETVEPLRQFLQAHPDALLFCAAGNSGYDFQRKRRAGSWGKSEQLEVNLKLDKKFLGKLLGSPPLENVLLVAAASQFNHELYHYSNRGGSWVEWAGYADTTYEQVDGAFAWETYGAGTSHAAPYLANVAAKCRLLAPSLSVAQLREVLRLSVVGNIPSHWVRTGGVVDSDRAVRLAGLVRALQNGMTESEAAAIVKIPSDQEPRPWLEAARRVLALNAPASP